MLQRSQTLFLLGVFILTVLMFTGPIADFTVENGVLTLKHSGVFILYLFMEKRRPNFGHACLENWHSRPSLNKLATSVVAVCGRCSLDLTFGIGTVE